MLCFFPLFIAKGSIFQLLFAESFLLTVDIDAGWQHSECFLGVLKPSKMIYSDP